MRNLNCNAFFHYTIIVEKDKGMWRSVKWAKMFILVEFEAWTYTAVY